MLTSHSQGVGRSQVLHKQLNKNSLAKLDLLLEWAAVCASKVKPKLLPDNDSVPSLYNDQGRVIFIFYFFIQVMRVHT